MGIVVARIIVVTKIGIIRVHSIGLVMFYWDGIENRVLIDWGVERI